MGRPEMAGKHKNPTTQGGGCRRVRRLDLGASSGVGREILLPRSSGGCAPLCPARVQ